MRKPAEAHIFIFQIPMKTDDVWKYVKIDEEGNKIEVLLNASNENVRVKGEGEILFARKFDGDILGANGTLIRKIGVTIQ